MQKAIVHPKSDSMLLSAAISVDPAMHAAMPACLLCCSNSINRALASIDAAKAGHSSMLRLHPACAPVNRVLADLVIALVSRLNFQAGSKLALAGTIQFAGSIQAARQQLATAFPSLGVPQAKPLSPGKPVCIPVHSSASGAAFACKCPASCLRAGRGVHPKLAHVDGIAIAWQSE